MATYVREPNTGELIGHLVPLFEEIMYRDPNLDKTKIFEALGIYHPISRSKLTCIYDPMKAQHRVI